MQAATKSNNETPDLGRRRAAMSILASSEAAAIEACLSGMSLPSFKLLREPEQGLVMLRGRIGGDGAAFNLGEATMARAAVRLASGEVGFGYTLGRDGNKARLIALCDALLQSDAHRGAVEAAVIKPLRAEVEAWRMRTAQQTAATKVDFYTLVRGEG